MASDREDSLRAAEKLLRQGKLDAAIAGYRKVIDDDPNDWNTANTLGDLYFRAGQIDKAVAEYARIADHLANEGFFQKAVAVYRKIIKIKPEDERSMWQLGGLAARQGLLADARSNFLGLIERRRARGDSRGEAEARAELGDLDGADVATRIAGARARVQLGDRHMAVQKLKQAAADLQEKDKDDEAGLLLAEALKIDPEDSDLRAPVPKPVVSAKRITDNPELLWTLAEMELRAGRIKEGRHVLHQILARDPGRHDEVVALGCSVAEENPAGGFECIEIVASAAIAGDKWDIAAAAVDEFVGRAPHHIPALMLLVEICVDAGLESKMHTVQAQLADAYLAKGAGSEARMIAEDLVARAPWEPANIERFRQALTLLGESDIDSIIAQRLSGQPPFTTTDFHYPPQPAPPVEGEPFAQPPPKPARQAADTKPEQHEVDLSEVLGGLRKGEAPPSRPVPIEDVLNTLREENVRDASPETAEQHIKLAATYVEMGLPHDAIKALEVAARSPRHCFRASAMIAKIHLDGNDHARAIEWYERAAEASAPTVEAHYALLYELGSLLETQGEHARALAVFLELQAEAGDYQDLTARLGHLAAELKR